MFEVIKGKKDRGDRYFNLDSIQSFHTYLTADGTPGLSILLLNRVESLSETDYEIDDFVNKMKDKSNL